MDYEEKLAIANIYLEGKIGLQWDDLADINSLHDADDVEGVWELCNDRLQEEGYFDDGNLDFI